MSCSRSSQSTFLVMSDRAFRVCTCTSTKQRTKCLAQDRPSQHFLVMSDRAFLGCTCTSTKQRTKCLAQDRPSQHFLVMSDRAFLGCTCTSTKHRIKCLARRHKVSASIPLLSLRLSAVKYQFTTFVLMDSPLLTFYHFYSTFNRTFCKQTVETLIRRRRMAYNLGLHCLPMPHKKDPVLTCMWVD